MKSKIVSLAITGCTSMLLFISCSKMQNKPLSSSTADAQSLQDKISENGANPDEAVFSETDKTSPAKNHFYIESNGTGTNSILVFSQKENGQLVLQDEVASGGYGLGKGLGSQGAIAITDDKKLLFAVNAGSNTISSFRIKDNGGLTLLFTAYSTGVTPNSITLHNNLLYLLNNGSSSVCGYSFTQDGFITPIKGSAHNLSGNNVDAPEISFLPDGSALLVTEKNTSIIDKFFLDNNGAVASAIQIKSTGVEPFSFDFTRNKNYLIVTNAANGGSGTGSCTSYNFSGIQKLDPINGAVSEYETAPCWIASTKFGVFSFISNTGSNNLSSYYTDQSGAITLVDAVAAAEGLAPVDIAVSGDNRYVYNIYSGSHSVVAYKRMPGGKITVIDKVNNLPAFASGLAAF